MSYQPPLIFFLLPSPFIAPPFSFFLSFPPLPSSVHRPPLSLSFFPSHAAFYFCNISLCLIDLPFCSSFYTPPLSLLPSPFSSPFLHSHLLFMTLPFLLPSCPCHTSSSPLSCNSHLPPLSLLPSPLPPLFLLSNLPFYLPNYFFTPTLKSGLPHLSDDILYCLVLRYSFHS